MSRQPSHSELSLSPSEVTQLHSDLASLGSGPESYFLRGGVKYFTRACERRSLHAGMAMDGRRAVAQSPQPTFSPASMARSESLHVCIAEPSIVSARSGSTEGTHTVTERRTGDINAKRSTAARAESLPHPEGHLEVESPLPVQRIPYGQ